MLTVNSISDYYTGLNLKQKEFTAGSHSDAEVKEQIKDAKKIVNTGRLEWRNYSAFLTDYNDTIAQHFGMFFDVRV